MRKGGDPTWDKLAISRITLQAAGLLETYDKEFSGRNRRYYKITVQGMAALDGYRRDWLDYRGRMDGILLGASGQPVTSES